MPRHHRRPRTGQAEIGNIHTGRDHIAIITVFPGLCAEMHHAAGIPAQLENLSYLLHALIQICSSLQRKSLQVAPALQVEERGLEGQFFDLRLPICDLGVKIEVDLAIPGKRVSFLGPPDISHHCCGDQIKPFLVPYQVEGKIHAAVCKAGIRLDLKEMWQLAQQYRQGKSALAVDHKILAVSSAGKLQGTEIRGKPHPGKLPAITGIALQLKIKIQLLQFGLIVTEKATGQLDIAQHVGAAEPKIIDPGCLDKQL